MKGVGVTPTRTSASVYAQGGVGEDRGVGGVKDGREVSEVRDF